jgi:hypothetical protein
MHALHLHGCAPIPQVARRSKHSCEKIASNEHAEIVLLNSFGQQLCNQNKQNALLNVYISLDCVRL